MAKGRYSASEDDKSRKAFTTLGPRALVADGRLWAIRVGNSDKLVATLQVSTMKLKVDLANTKERNAIVNNIIPGQREKIEVGTVSVVQSTTEDTTTYVWFGHDLFEVLQLKRSQKDPVDAEAILTEIVGYQTARPDWKGLPGADDGSDATGVG